MWNNSISSESGITLASVETGDGSFTSAEQTAVAGYITAAQTFVNNPANASFFNSFAVVSGGVSSTYCGLLLAGIRNSDLYRFRVSYSASRASVVLSCSDLST